jgi:hypothetical protein
VKDLKAQREKTRLSHVTEIYVTLNYNSVYFFETTSLHALPKHETELEAWFNEMIKHTNTVTYKNEDDKPEIISFLGFRRQPNVASLTLLKADTINQSLINKAIEDSIEYAFEQEPMQRMCIYVKEDDIFLKERLSNYGFEYECSFNEAYWENGKYKNIDVFGKLKDL